MTHIAVSILFRCKPSANNLLFPLLFQFDVKSNRSITAQDFIASNNLQQRINHSRIQLKPGIFITELFNYGSLTWCNSEDSPFCHRLSQPTRRQVGPLSVVRQRIFRHPAVQSPETRHYTHGTNLCECENVQTPDPFRNATTARLVSALYSDMTQPRIKFIINAYVPATHTRGAPCLEIHYARWTLTKFHQSALCHRYVEA